MTTTTTPDLRVLESLFYSALGTVLVLKAELASDAEEDKRATAENLAGALASGRWVVKTAAVLGAQFPAVF